MVEIHKQINEWVNNIPVRMDMGNLELHGRAKQYIETALLHDDLYSPSKNLENKFRFNFYEISEIQWANFRR